MVDKRSLIVDKHDRLLGFAVLPPRRFHAKHGSTVPLVPTPSCAGSRFQSDPLSVCMYVHTYLYIRTSNGR